MRTTFSPYGVAVDGKLEGGTIVTTTARQQDASARYGGGIVIYKASQGAPTDADRVYKFEDGSPIFAGVRRVAVNEKTHQAFVTNLGNSRGSGSDGFIAVLDLTKRGAAAVQARVTIPDAVGAVGVDVDEANNLVYVGSMVGEKLYVIDMDKVDTSDAKNLDLNDDAVTELDANVGANARPTYSPELKRVYVSAYAAPEGTISVVDADPKSDDYGKVIDTIKTGPTNSVSVDGKRGLLYSANLGDKKVAVFDTKDHEKLLEVPTSGNAVNLGIDPKTGKVWVSNFSNAGKTDVITVKDPAAPQPVKFIDVPTNHKFYAQIQWMAQNKITTGVKTSKGLAYQPKAATSREAMAAFLFRLYGDEDFKAPKKSPFSDISTSHKFYKEIAWMHAEKISTGTKQKKGLPKHEPKASTSREAMAAFLYRAEGVKGFKAPSKSPFADVKKSDKFYTQIAWMAEEGISTGTKQKKGLPKYEPKASTSREAMSAFLYRAAN